MRQWILLGAVAFSAALPLRAQGDVRFLLVGDSTVSVKSGWGPAFCQDVKPSVTCENLAVSGRSSKSYRAEGLWDKVVAKLKGNAKFSTTYVLIQFGHNDQPGKPGRSTDVATEFPPNMKAYVTEVKAAGAIPVLVTPLARRSWAADGKLRDSLGPWADADKAVAAETGALLLDLHGDSMAALERMGREEGDTLAMAPPPAKDAPAPTKSTEVNGEAALKFDGTHLGAKGAKVFAAIVEQELVAAAPATAGSFKKE